MSNEAQLFFDGRCRLGEGPLWHPLRQQLFWFDILEKTLFAATADGVLAGRWTFPRYASAASMIDKDTLAVAMAGAVIRLDLTTGAQTTLVTFEAELPNNRTNDGRANPAGGLWFGTMDFSEEPYSGSLYQFRKGVLKQLGADIRIPNATCFSPDGRIAYFTDTPNKIIMKRPIDPATGEPTGFWTVFRDTSGDPGFPDGAVIDSEGFMWCARWGGGRVIRYAPDGSVDREVRFPVSQTSCPAFGGADLKTLYVTSASKTLSREQLAREPHAGSVYAVEVDVAGQREPILAL